jgi:hypothetical protein
VKVVASYRRHRTVRVLCALALVPIWAIVAFVAINSFGNYSHVGDELGVAAIALFAAWGWWWSDRRDRRAAGDERSGQDDR